MKDWAPLEAPERKVHQRSPQPKEPGMDAYQKVRSRSRKVVDASAPEIGGFGYSLPRNTRTSDRGKRLETNTQTRHNGMEADKYSIRHVPTGYNGVSSRSVTTERHRNRNIDDLFDGSETAGAVNDTAKSLRKPTNCKPPFDMADSSAPMLPHSSKTSDANLPDSVPLLYANHGPRPRDLFTIADFKSSINHGYTKNRISAAVQGIPKTFNVEHGSELPDQMLCTGQAQGSPMINTGVSRKSQQ